MHSAEQCLHQYYGAFLEKDWTAFAALLDEGFHYFTDTGIVQSKEAFINFLRRNDWEGKSYSISNLHLIPSAAGDMVIATYSIEFIGSGNENGYTVRANETTVLRNEQANEQAKGQGEWKIRHSHSSNYA